MMIIIIIIIIIIIMELGTMRLINKYYIMCEVNRVRRGGP